MSSLPNGDHLNSSGTAKAKKKTKKKKPGVAKPDTQHLDVEAKAALNGEEEEDRTPVESPSRDEAQTAPPAPKPATNGTPKPGADEDGTNLSEKLDALAIERDNLRHEVAELRQSLEKIRGNHKDEVQELQDQVDKAEEGREHAEQQHASLLERVKDLGATFRERMKTNAEELARANTQIEEAEEENVALRDANAALEETIARLHSEHAQSSRDADSLHERATLAQQNWDRERDELLSKKAYAKEEYETARQAMQDWEVLAMEERSLRENLGEKVGDLEDQVATLRESYERALLDRDGQSQAVEGLQRTLRELQDERKRELRELVESSQAQIEEAQTQYKAAEEAAQASQAELEKVQKELERALPFEKEVREKRLLIGKLRHEAVGLNEHLIKALRFIQQNKPNDMVDREIVSNYLLHFLMFDGSDGRKFETLRLIASALNWNEEQREKAGLSRPGATKDGSAPSSTSLRLPLAPFRRNASTTALTESSLMEQRSPGASKETLSELWSEFLEREAAGGEASSTKSSRRPSTVSPIVSGSNLAALPASSSSSSAPGPTSGAPDPPSIWEKK